jgi:N5-(carboxyethyl)ornithine synthase
MKLGFIKPNYPNEKRVALLPKDIKDFKNELVIESGFGEFLDIPDADYKAQGCLIKSRDEVFKECDTLFNLKLIHPTDYDKVRIGQMIIGWTHPTGSGINFMKLQAIPKELVIVDLDNIYPFVYYGNKKIPISFIKPNFIWRNSYMAGFSSTLHAILTLGILPDTNTKVAVLSSGNVAQGALSAISKFNCNVRLFYRKTMELFYESIYEYDIIINGIEIDNDNSHIITKEDLQRIKRGCIIIDAAADAGRAIEGTRYTTIGDPVYLEDGKYHYEVNNSPSIFYRETSKIISEVFSELIYKKDVQQFWDLLKLFS